MGFLQIQRVWILTGLQFLNVVLWSFYAKNQIVHKVDGGEWIYYALGLHMIWVGFMGGAVYANCMFLFNTAPQIPDKYREIGINLGFFFSNIGIVCATSTAAFLDSTSFSDKELFPPDGACPAVGALAAI